MHDQRDPTPAIQSQQQADRQPKRPPAAQGDPHGQRRDPHGVQKRRVHHGAHENQAAQGNPHGAQQKRVHHGAQESTHRAAKAEAERQRAM